jgi:hypothetical protein
MLLASAMMEGVPLPVVAQVTEYPASAREPVNQAVTPPFRETAPFMSEAETTR